jgi:hypothetical protein
MQQGIGKSVLSASVGLILPIGGSTLVDVGAKVLDGNAYTSFEAARDVPSPSIDFVLSSASTITKATEAFIAAAKVQDDPKKAAKERAAAWKQAYALVFEVGNQAIGNPLAPAMTYVKRAAEAATNTQGDTPSEKREMYQAAAERPSEAARIIRPLVVEARASKDSGQKIGNIRDALIRAGMTRDDAIKAIRATGSK